MTAPDPRPHHGGTALLVVDGAEAVLAPCGAPGRDAVAAASAVLATARGAGVLVLHSRLSFRVDGLDGGHYFRHDPALAVHAGPLPPADPRLAPVADELVVTRTYPSAFFGTSLAATLRGAGIGRVMLVGATTSGAVRIAAVDAMQHGFLPVVVADAVADVTVEQHRAALRDLSMHYAELLSASGGCRLLEQATATSS